MQYKQNQLLSREGIIISEINLPWIEEHQYECCLVRCVVHQVEYNEMEGRWMFEGVKVLGYASIAKTLPDR